MITPRFSRVLGDSRACLTCVTSFVLIAVKTCIPAASGLFGHVSGRVQGLWSCCLSGMRTMGGSCGGRFLPPQVTTIERGYFAEAERSPYSVRMHASCARNAHAPGHSTYLMITVPIDTILSISNLQLFWQKMQGHFVLI